MLETLQTMIKEQRKKVEDQQKAFLLQTKEAETWQKTLMLEAEDYKHKTQDRKAMIQKQQHMQEYISAE